MPVRWGRPHACSHPAMARTLCAAPNLPAPLVDALSRLASTRPVARPRARGGAAATTCARAHAADYVYAHLHWRTGELSYVERALGLERQGACAGARGRSPSHPCRPPRVPRPCCRYGRQWGGRRGCQQRRAARRLLDSARLLRGAVGGLFFHPFFFGGGGAQSQFFPMKSLPWSFYTTHYNQTHCRSVPATGRRRRVCDSVHSFRTHTHA